MKRVLVISSHFPPVGGIAQMRIASFVRHLPAFGWEPSVITIGWTCDNSDWIDDSLQDEELERRVVLRSREPDLRRGRSKVPSLLRAEGFRLDLIAAYRQIMDRVRHGERVEGSWYFMRAAERFIRQHLLEQRYDLILATSPDLAPLRIASAVSQRHGIPWVADCRDDYVTLKPERPIHGHLELKFLQSAAAIVTVSNGVREVLEARTGRKVEVVENGFERRDAEELPTTGRLDAQDFNIVYTGSLANYYPERNPEVLLSGIAKLLEEDPRRRIRVHFFGDNKLQPVMDDLFAKFPGLANVLVNHGRVPFSVANALQREADVLLVLAHPGLKGILTGKVFEYLASGRPIVSVPGDCDELDALLERTRGGRALQTAEESARYLKEAYADWQRDGAVPCNSDQEEIGKFSRRELTRKLAAILDSVTATKGSA